MNVNPQGMVDLFEGMQNAQISIREIFKQNEDSITTEDNVADSINETTEETFDAGSIDTELSTTESQEETSDGYVENTVDQFTKMLSTHPNTEDRIIYLNAQVQEYRDHDFPDNLLAKELFEQLKGGGF